MCSRRGAGGTNIGNDRILNRTSQSIQADSVNCPGPGRVIARRGEVSDVSDSSELLLIVQAVEALLADDADEARRTLEAAIEVSSPAAVNHRLSVVGRALLADAALDSDRGPVPDPTPIEHVEDEAAHFATTWAALEAVAMLVNRGGYPAEVLLTPGAEG